MFANLVKTTGKKTWVLGKEGKDPEVLLGDHH